MRGGLGAGARREAAIGRARVLARRDGVTNPKAYLLPTVMYVLGLGNDGSRGRDPSLARLDEYEDDSDNALGLPYQPFVRLNIIHITNDVIVLHLDGVNLLWITFDHTFAAYIPGNPQD